MDDKICLKIKDEGTSKKNRKEYQNEANLT